MFEGLLLSAALSLMNPSARYAEAASKATQAFMIQSGVSSLVQAVDAQAYTRAVAAAETTGVPREVIGGTIYVVHVAKDKQATVKMPGRVIGGVIYLTAQRDGGRIGLGWSF